MQWRKLYYSELRNHTRTWKMLTTTLRRGCWYKLLMATNGTLNDEDRDWELHPLQSVNTTFSVPQLCVLVKSAEISSSIHLNELDSDFDSSGVPQSLPDQQERAEDEDTTRLRHIVFKYFRRYFPQSFIEEFACFTKIYAMQIKTAPEVINALSGILPDEQFIPFTAVAPAMRFVWTKPYPEGVKVFVHCSTNDVAHDFELCSGKGTGTSHENKQLEFEASIGWD